MWDEYMFIGNEHVHRVLRRKWPKGYNGAQEGNIGARFPGVRLEGSIFKGLP